MRKSYKKLGDYIQQVDIRNKDFNNYPLLGVSVKKIFIPSIANIIGSDMSKYKLLKINQFTYIADTSRRGDKIGIALLKEHENALISQAYTTFKIRDFEELNPDYLMMWFSRPEFDRYARYHSIGSVRETFDWADLCDVELPVPSIEKQKDIVAQYQSITNKIKVNEQICEKLEATTQALYKHWFVDFEFPNEQGDPYKSAGGLMVFDEELDMEIPEGWKYEELEFIVDKTTSGSTPSRGNDKYWNKGNIPWLKTGELKDNVIITSEERITELALKETSVKIIPKNSILLAMYGEGKTKGTVGFLKIEATTNQACCALISEDINIMSFIYYSLKLHKDELLKNAIGGAQPNLSKTIIDNFKILYPKKNLIDQIGFGNFITYQEVLENQNQKLTEIQSLLLSRLASLEEEVIETTN